MEAGGDKIQGHPQGLGEFEARLGCKRPHLKRGWETGEFPPSNPPFLFSNALPPASLSDSCPEMLYGISVHTRTHYRMNSEYLQRCGDTQQVGERSGVVFPFGFP